MKSSQKNNKEFRFGSFVYHYDLIIQERKSMSLTVRPDLSICVKCPQEADEDRIENFLKRKWFWLEKQLSFFKKYQRKVYKKDYVSGEGFFYLGRQYKLKIEGSPEERVVLSRGLLTVFTSKDLRNTSYNKILIGRWYKEKTDKIFRERYELMLEYFKPKEKPKLVIKEMKRRWGSYLKNNTIILNSKLIHSSKECIDYVIAHELCHMNHKNHDKKFYNLLEKKFPNWRKVKEKLEITGIQFFD